MDRDNRVNRDTNNSICYTEVVVVVVVIHYLTLFIYIVH